MRTSDFLIIGGGIIGINLARTLKRTFNDAAVTIIEKEPAPGEHASGRNSGVLHAGFYYTADSLKARFTRDGNRLLSEYCRAHNLPINRCGKLVVAGNEAEDRMLDELVRRGEQNGVPLQIVSPEEAAEIEPRAITRSRAVYSPTTASADPMAVIQHQEQQARAEGIRIDYNVAYTGGVNERITATKDTYSAGYVVNAAGLYADKVARAFGYSQDYAILPFKGLYLKCEEPAGSFRTHIYPVPDLANPFLGVHFTVQVDGAVKLGPTAIPALWREQYQGMANFSVAECRDIAARSFGLLSAPAFDFKRLAVQELRKYSRRRMVSLAGAMARDVKPGAFRHWSKPGIRAQLLRLSQRKLEMDFVLEGDARSMHILNAVSPGWTCSMPFSQYVTDEIVGRLN